MPLRKTPMAASAWEEHPLLTPATRDPRLRAGRQTRGPGNGAPRLLAPQRLQVVAVIRSASVLSRRILRRHERLCRQILALKV